MHLHLGCRGYHLHRGATTSRVGVSGDTNFRVSGITINTNVSVSGVTTTIKINSNHTNIIKNKQDLAMKKMLALLGCGLAAAQLQLVLVQLVALVIVQLSLLSMIVAISVLSLIALFAVLIVVKV